MSSLSSSSITSSPSLFSRAVVEATAEVLAIKARWTAAVGFGTFSNIQLGRDAGATWKEIYALQDAGLIRYERGSSCGGITWWMLTF